MKRIRYNGKLFKMLDNCGFKFSNNEVTFNDVKIDFTGYSLADIPFKYQKIEVVEIEGEKEEVIFTGYLDTIKPSFITKKKKGYRELALTLLSPLKMATVRTVSLIGTYSKEECIRRILQPLIDDGFTIEELNIDDGQMTVNFVLETIENAMNNVCSKASIFWFIDEKRGIYVNSIDYLFGKAISKTITENDDFEADGLININPTIENVDYSNIINFKNVRLIYSEKDTNSEDAMAVENGYNIYPILNLNKKIKKGDVIDFINPVIVDENTLRQVIDEGNLDSNQDFYCLYLQVQNSSNQYQTYSIKIRYENGEQGTFTIDNNITFSDSEGEEGKIVLQRDNFFSNLITGFKWNDEEVTIVNFETDTGLRYTTMKFMYTAEIENLKGIISDSGQIEKTIDFNDKWTTLNQLVNYARSLMIQNSNTVNTVQLEYDIDPNLKIGDIVNIELSSFYTEGNFAVKEINYTYTNEIEQNWKITLKSADLVSTYIDLFRPAETEETEDKIDTVTLSEFIEENIKEMHTVSIQNEGNHTLNFNL